MRAVVLVAAVLVSDALGAGLRPQYSEPAQFVFFVFLVVCLAADTWDFISRHRRRH